jgi:DNA-binding FrmR family transcriptional regulator
MKPELKQQSLLHLKKAEGMLKKVIQMLEKGEYCMDIVQQNQAVQGCLKSAEKVILENHLNTCFKSGMESKNTSSQKKLIAEMLAVLNRK